MEPFRPVVDLAVVHLLRGGASEVTPDCKRTLASVLRQEELTPMGMSPLSTSLIRLAASVAESFLLKEFALELPLIAGR